MNRVELRFLRRFRDAQPHGLGESQVPVGARGLLQRLQTAGAVNLVPGVRGNLWRIGNPTAFDMAVASMAPSGLDVDLAQLESRAQATMQLGDAKGISVGQSQGIFIRAAKAGVVLRGREGQTLDVSALTALAGGAAILLGGAPRWQFDGMVATVENEEAFWLHHKILPGADLAVYVRGRMSERLLSWLASAELGGCRFIHWGDYDPTGIAEYIRLRNACPGRVTLHVPDDIEALLARYGKRELVEGQTVTLHALRSDPDETVQQLVSIFDRHRRGLEQELLLALAESSAELTTDVMTQGENVVDDCGRS